LQRHLEASGKARKGAAADAEGGTRGGCNVSGTIAARFGQSRNNHEECVVQAVAGTLGRALAKSRTEIDNHGAYIPVAQPVPYDLFQVTAPVNRQNRKPGDPCHTLARDNAAHAAIAIQGNLVGRETGGPQGVGASTDGAMYTLTKADTHAVAHTMTVRRLTPVECERLQGFPDNWTLIPWRKKPAEECPDGPRYKALGNSMATNVVTWIGERIQAYETETKVRAAQTMDSRGNPSA
jgi:site-specific DNA-cytosine methylase